MGRVYTRALKQVEKPLAQKFNFAYRYIDNVLNNSKISEFIDPIYSCDLEIKDTTEPNISASYLYCYLCTDNGKLVTSVAGGMWLFHFCPRGVRGKLNHHDQYRYGGYLFAIPNSHRPAHAVNII